MPTEKYWVAASAALFLLLLGDYLLPPCKLGEEDSKFIFSKKAEKGKQRIRIGVRKWERRK